jgi:hypothetical protein
MEGIKHWELCEDLSVKQAAMLATGLDPYDGEKIDPQDWDANENTLQAITSAIVSGLRAGTIEGKIVLQTHPLTDAPIPDSIDILESRVDVKSFKRFLASRAVRGGFFFPKGGEGADHIEDAVTARGAETANWKTLYEQLVEQSAKRAEEDKAEIDRLRSECKALAAQLAAANKATAKLNPKERDSLLKLVVGMAVQSYRWDPEKARCEKVAVIAGALERAGVPLDVDTVRKWLREAAKLLPPSAPK